MSEGTNDDVLEVLLPLGKTRVKDAEKPAMKVEEEEERGSTSWQETLLSTVEKTRLYLGTVSREENAGLREQVRQTLFM